MNKLDQIDRKIERNEKLTLEEWQCLNLDTCSEQRDVYFPGYCQTQGLVLKSEFRVSIWEAIWNKALDDYERNQTRKLANAKYNVSLKLRTSQKDWRAPDIKRALAEVLEKKFTGWIFEPEDLDVKFVGYLEEKSD